MTTRVAGHALRHEGRPVLSDECGCGTPETDLQCKYYSFVKGHGLCSCGGLSPCESTHVARQRWHRQHKTDITSNAAERTP